MLKGSVYKQFEILFVYRGAYGIMNTNIYLQKLVIIRTKHDEIEIDVTNIFINVNFLNSLLHMHCLKCIK